MSIDHWLAQGAEVLAARTLERDDPDGERCVPDFDLVVVGSGYGGAVAAARLAGRRDRDGRSPRVALLERGQEYVPGSFPSRFADLPGHVRIGQGGTDAPVGNRAGLFDIRLGRSVSALVGNGLGGGSLINAGVVERPTPEVFEQGWPGAIRADGMAPWFARVEATLEAAPMPASQPMPVKFDALRMLGRASDAPHGAQRARIAVNWQAGTNAAGVPMQPCLSCGDCVTGCNHAAKNTLATNYLPIARRRGAELFTGITVLHLTRRTDGAWILHAVFTDPAVQTRWEAGLRSDAARGPHARPRLLTIVARRVVLSAGAYGSTEILLRTRALGRLPLSSRLGDRFSVNGDMIAVGHGTRRRINASALEQDPPARRGVGPTITGKIDQRGGRAKLADQLVIEEMAVPGPLRRLYEEVLATVGMAWGLEHADRTHHLSDDPASIDRPRTDRSSIYAVMGHDFSPGRLRLHRRHLLPRAGRDLRPVDGQIVVDWPRWEFPNSTFAQGVRRLAALHRRSGLGGRVLPDPFWKAMPSRLGSVLGGGTGGGTRPGHFTVHPLGGCAMGDDAASGVVDHFGRVFAGQAGAAVHAGLAVLDGAIVPTSLGINPCLTIAALAERAADGLAQDWGWVEGPVALPQPLPPGPPTCPVPPAAGEPTRLRYAEAMRGTARSALHGGAAELSLRMVFAPVADLGAFVAAARKRLSIADATLVIDGPLGRSQARVTGELDLLHRLPTTLSERFRTSVWAWWVNRGARDLIHGFLAPQATGRPPELVGPPIPVEPTPSALGIAWRAFYALIDGRTGPEALRALPALTGIPRKLAQFKRLASHVGERRAFTYTMTLVDEIALGARVLPAGTRLHGEKRVQYRVEGFGGPRVDPWTQITRMRLEAEAPDGERLLLGELSVDLGFLMSADDVQLDVQRAASLPDAIADLASFGLFYGRALGHAHLWSWRAPDYPTPYPSLPFDSDGRHGPLAPPRDAWRLPDAPPGLDWQTLRLPGVVRNGTRMRSSVLPTFGRRPRQRAYAVLTPYLREPGKRGPAGPVLFIHGFGAAGNTFTLDTVRRNLVEHFLDAGHDAFVLDLRTSIGLDTSLTAWHFDEVARFDVPAGVREVLARYPDRPLTVFAHCIGAALFCMATLSGRIPSHRIRAAVLSQVGPLVELPQFNRVRGFAAGWLRNLLGARRFSVTAPLTGRERIVDRLLAPWPYEGGERALFRPKLGCVEFDAFANRAHAIYGKLFEARNLAPATLASLGLQLGHTSVRTYLQTVYYATEGRLTDRDGRNAYVTDAQVRRRMAFPLMMLHGAANQVFDPLTAERTLTLVRGCLDHPPGTLAAAVIPGYGHQDMMIGRRAHADVYPQATRFLAALPPAPRITRRPLAWTLRTPRIGPVLGALSLAVAGPGRATLRLLLEADDRGSPPRAVLAWPVDPQGRTMAAPTLHAVRLREPATPTVIELDLPAGSGPVGVRVVTLHRERAAWDEVIGLWPALAVPRLRAALRRARGLALPHDPTDPPTMDDLAAALGVADARHAATLSADPPQAADVADAAESAGPPPPALVRATAWLTAAQLDATRRDLAFVVGSCRYPHQRIDQPMGEAVLARLQTLIAPLPSQGGDPTAPGPLGVPGAALDETLDPGPVTDDGAPVPRFAMLLGDQIYADATAGVADPVESRDRFVERYRDAYRTPAARAIHARLPSYMILDDHEIEDNWEPGLARNARERRRGRDALRAYERWQADLAPTAPSLPAPPPNGHRRYWYTFRQSGLGFFVMDTRTERHRPPFADAVAPDSRFTSPRICSDEQFDALERWLLAEDAEARADGDPARPKFVALPAVPLPMGRETRGHPAYALRSDAWDGFPLSLHRLMGFIATHAIRGVVMLTGDYHCSGTFQVDVAAAGGVTVPFQCVMSSGSYAPWPFANSGRGDLRLAWRGVLHEWFGLAAPPAGPVLTLGYRPLAYTESATLAVVDTAPPVRAGDSWTVTVRHRGATGTTMASFRT